VIGCGAWHNDCLDHRFWPSIPKLTEWQSVACGIGAFTNEFMTTYAAHYHLNIGKRCSVQIVLVASFH
jgi:hypothetical protein